MTKKRNVLGIVLAAVAATAGFPVLEWGGPVAQAESGVVAIRGARLITVAGADIPNGTIVFEGGRIAAVGADVVVPEGARLIDGDGLTVTPGFIDGFTAVGLREIGSLDPDVDEPHAAVVPQLRAADALNPDNRFVDIARRAGTTCVLVVPGDHNLLAGQSALVSLGGRTATEMILSTPFAMHATLGERPKRRFGAKEKAPATRMGEMALLRQTLVDAQAYRQKVRAAKAGGKPPDRDLKLEALVPVVSGELPLVVSADARIDIMNALRLASEFDLKLVLGRGAEADRVVDQLAARKIPVIIGPLSAWQQSVETLRASPATAAALHRAGVRFAFQSGVDGQAGDLLALARAAIAAGLPREAAFGALTLDAAAIFGIEDLVGSLEVGKRGDVAVFDGDPLGGPCDVRMVTVSVGSHLEVWRFAPSHAPGGGVSR
jgi:imidazolonepropionase-like amidohydrolase